ncbi:1-acyl-sn-glycerol-3-phosphate acyltransferase [Flavihumibacter rivuli]|uniref:1-acyl-sn-glycerol-3-phosphate acyltransferase n=1 Tax=Flavihumibacter rivuli TaxID=2838156 RepID=UPI001BDEC0B9|nr:1-acyl-sn-glycerol-3-phosphate acyltransferase [Flavihumibacter rivuli]ULQ56080.1 1-acyl-sn-glycerol-3-phosphate acyltransferase [Flavihumibacter rivuli]
MIGKLFWSAYWKSAGWKVIGRWPSELTKAIIIVGPHTSSEDVVVGMAARAVIPIRNAHFLGKKELFDGPFGWFFRMAGGVPVDRSGNKNMVDQVVEIIARKEKFVLALSPEGTRKKVDRLRTGFWHIAHKAGLPLVMAGMDFGKKELVFSEPFMTGESPEIDMPRIIDFFANIEGKVPENDMRHLKQIQ